jgi:sigma-B regulation protein RsbU (phosphoserine phosphatase)
MSQIPVAPQESSEGSSEIALQRGRQEAELQIARQLQASLMLNEPLELTGWEFAFRWWTGSQVAADYCDTLEFSNGKMGLILADVSDKGLPAALFVTAARSTLRASLDGAPTPREGVARANRLLSVEAAEGMYLTLFYALIDTTRSQITYVNAGHTPPLMLHRPASGISHLSQLGRTGMALGVKASSPYDQFIIRFNPGDFLVLFSDGLITARSLSEEEFGSERLEQIVLGSGGGTAEDLARKLEHALKGFAGERVFDDDVILLIAKRR